VRRCKHADKNLSLLAGETRLRNEAIALEGQKVSVDKSLKKRTGQHLGTAGFKEGRFVGCLLTSFMVML
jgi:hypothetical protein